METKENCTGRKSRSRREKRRDEKNRKSTEESREGRSESRVLRGSVSGFKSDRDEKDGPHSPVLGVRS